MVTIIGRRRSQPAQDLGEHKAVPHLPIYGEGFLTASETALVVATNLRHFSEVCQGVGADQLVPELPAERQRLLEVRRRTLRTLAAPFSSS